MTKDKKPTPSTNTSAEKPKPAAKPQPSYVQFQGGYQSSKGGNMSGGKRGGGASGSPIRKSAPSGGGK